MIEYEETEKAFKNYLTNYNLADGGIKLKVVHTYKVVEKSEYIAKSLGLDEENITLAKVIGLLHDIGRFEQVKKNNDFSDNTGFNHADYGVKVLFKDNMIRKFVTDQKYDKIIEKAIYNHNKYKIEEGLNEIELLHSKMIRDADKLDNFRVKEKEDFKNMFLNQYNAETINYEEVSTKVYNDFMQHKCIKLMDRKTQIDYWVCVIAFIFDFYFTVSLEYIKENEYIDKLVDRIQYKNKTTKNQMENIRKCAKEYINNKVNER